MVYRVLLADRAKSDADQIYDWVSAEAPVRGPAWFDELIEALHSLEALPGRCPLAREAKEVGQPVRCPHLGKRNHVYRILFEIHEDRREVCILHIRHGARLDQPLDEAISVKPKASSRRRPPRG